MQVPISYFDPNNGQAQNLEQRCNELFANGVSEIIIPELGSTYSSDPLQITQLMDDVTQYYEKRGHAQSGVNITATVVVDDEIDVSSSELKEGETKIENYATFSSACGIILGLLGVLFGVHICGEDPVIGGTIIGVTIGSCVQLFLLSGFLRFVAKLSVKVRQLEENQ